MAHRDWYVGIVGAILVTVGLFVLGLPVFLDQYDDWGWQIECGNGFAADLSQARTADAGGSTSVDACETALMVRRMWAIPLVALGTVAVVLVLLRAALTPQDRSVAAGRDGA